MQEDNRPSSSSSFKRRKFDNQNYPHRRQQPHDRRNHRHRRNGDRVAAACNPRNQTTTSISDSTKHTNNNHNNSCSVCETGAPNYKCPKCRAIYCSIVCCRKHKEEFCSNNPTTSNTNTESMAALGDETQTTTTTPSLVSSKYVTNADSIDLNTDSYFDNNNKHDNNNSNEYDGLEDGWIMTAEMMDAIGQSEWLRSELNNDVGLRHLIAQISRASNRAVHTNRNHRRNHGNNNSINADQIITEKERLLAELRSQNPPFRQFLDKLLVVAGILERHPDDNVPLHEWLAREDTLTDNHLTLKPLAAKRQCHINHYNQDSHQSPRAAPNNESPSGDESSDSESSSSEDELNCQH